MMIRVAPLDAGMCRDLAANMRLDDRRELEAMSGAVALADREDAMLDLLAKSRGLARAALVDGQVVTAWGVVTQTLIAPVGHPWMLATGQILDPHFSRVFLKRCKAEFLATIPPHVSSLWNLVDCENEIAIKWLKWMRFRFKDEIIDHGGLRWLWFGMEGA